MKKTFLLFITAFIICAISANAQQGSLINHIPVDATTVYEINIPVITSKVSWQEIIKNFPNKKHDSANDQMMEMLKDPSLAGVDIKQDIIIAKSGNALSDSATYTTVIGHISNAEKFGEAFLRSKPRSKIIITPNKYRQITEDNSSVSWNNNFFVAVSVKPSWQGKNPFLDSVMNKDRDLKNSQSKKINYDLLASRKSTEALKGFDRSFFISDENFKAGFADNADIHIWAEQPNTLQLLKKMNPANMFSMMQDMNDSSYKHGNKMLASVRFDNGRIAIDSKNFIAPALHSFYQKLNVRPMNMDLMKKIPHENVLGFFSISFDPTIITDLLGNGKTRKKIDSSLAAKNMKLDDVIGIFKGDFLFVVALPEKTDTSQEPRSPIYFGATINNWESLNKLIAEIKNADNQKGKNSFDKIKMSYNTKENIFGFSGSQEMADAFVNNEATTTTDLLTDKMKSNSFNLVMDFKAISDLLNSKGDISPKLKSVVGFFRILDKLIITRGGYANNISEAHFELTMTDNSENSLRTLVKLFAGGK